MSVEKTRWEASLRPVRETGHSIFMILVNSTKFSTEFFRVGAEFFCNEPLEHHIMVGWFAGYDKRKGINSCIFTEYPYKATRMCEEFAMNMVEYLKETYERMEVFEINGKRYGILSPTTYTCEIGCDGNTFNFIKF